MTVGKDVTVNVTQGGNPADVVVGGATTGALTVDQGKLNARNLSVGGVSGQAGGQFVSQVNIANSAQVALTGKITLGAKNGYDGLARRAGNISVTNLVVDTNAQVTVGVPGLLPRPGSIAVILARRASLSITYILVIWVDYFHNRNASKELHLRRQIERHSCNFIQDKDLRKLVFSCTDYSATPCFVRSCGKRVALRKTSVSPC